MIQKSYEKDSSNLYLIPTPIGNLEDITLRSIKTLEKVDYLLCEDTRVTAELLKHLKISKKLIHSDDHNEDKVKETVLKKLKDGYNIGLVTDRGTPIISDPGYKIVEYVTSLGFSVISLPGATAFVPALTASGIEPAPFLFYGFLNSKENKKIQELETLKKLPYTLIFYEAPHRLKVTLEKMLEVFGDRKICVSREISKLYEEYIRDSISNVLSIADGLKGEFVIVVEGNKHIEDYSSISILEHVNLYIEDGMKPNDAMKIVAKERNISKSVIYKEYHNKKREED